MTRPIPRLLDMMRQLIATPSVSSVNPEYDQPNQPVLERMAPWLTDLGFTVELQPVPGHPGKANLIATLQEGPGGLVLSGHTDTVPYDKGRWRYDPFSLTEKGGRLYGLGTSDMKAFFAIAIAAASYFAARDLHQPLIILATADEESSMSGAKALVETGWPRARYAVIGEPTGLKPVHTHKGIMMEAIRVRGRSGHSSDPALGASALEGMHRVIAELLAWRAELQATYRNPLFSVPVPTLNLGYIRGGDNPNRICAECELQIDLRPLPGMDLDDLRTVLRSRLEGVVEGSGLAIEVSPLFPGVPTLETEAASAIVRAAERLTGHSAGAAAFATEGPFLSALGMETVILGPGDIAQAHQPDEYLALERVQPALDILQGLIAEFCLTSERVV
jgi:acetylornithine deacetylase